MKFIYTHIWRSNCVLDANQKAYTIKHAIVAAIDAGSATTVVRVQRTFFSLSFYIIINLVGEHFNASA